MEVAIKMVHIEVFEDAQGLTMWADSGGDSLNVAGEWGPRIQDFS